MLWILLRASVSEPFMMIERKMFWIFITRRGGIHLPNSLRLMCRLADERKGVSASPSAAPTAPANTTATAGIGSTAPASEKTPIGP